MTAILASFNHSKPCFCKRVSGRRHLEGDAETHKTAHPTLGVELSPFDERFDEPVAKLGRRWSERKYETLAGISISQGCGRC